MRDGKHLSNPKFRANRDLNEPTITKEAVLSFTVWQGKKEPEAEVLEVQIRQPQAEGMWGTTHRLSIYRTPQGEYRELPERRDSK